MINGPEIGHLPNESDIEAKQKLFLELFDKKEELEKQEIEIEAEFAKIRRDRNLPEDTGNEDVDKDLHKKYQENDFSLDELKDELYGLVKELDTNQKEYNNGETTELGQIEINMDRLKKSLTEQE